MTWEYSYETCELWQMADLAMDWQAKHGWEVVSVVNAPRLLATVSEFDEHGEPKRVALVEPVAILFRRPIPTGDADG